MSDLDTIAVLRSDATAGQLAALAELHARIVREMPGWEDRVEVVYLSTHALMDFREPSPAARIAPGEPPAMESASPLWTAAAGAGRVPSCSVAGLTPSVQLHQSIVVEH